MHMRAKFRHLESIVSQDGGHTTRLRPVTAKSQYAPEGSEENLSFWTATPTGEAAVVGPEPVPHGAACFIDLVSAEDGGVVPDAEAWTLAGVTLHGNAAQVSVEFRPVAGWGSFVQMGIQRAETNRALLPHILAMLTHAVDGTPAPRWRVTFKPAPG